MRKILLTLTIIFSFLFSFGQDDFRLATSDKLSVSEKNTITNDFSFPEFVTIEPVEIVLRNDKVEIKSKVKQEYDIISEPSDLEDVKGSCWMAKDVQNINCRIYLYLDKSERLTLAVEYNDCSWMYLIKPVK
jgi:hypothetical protein